VDRLLQSVLAQGYEGFSDPCDPLGGAAPLDGLCSLRDPEHAVGAVLVRLKRVVAAAHYRTQSRSCTVRMVDPGKRTRYGGRDVPWFVVTQRWAMGDFPPPT